MSVSRITVDLSILEVSNLTDGNPPSAPSLRPGGDATQGPRSENRRVGPGLLRRSAPRHDGGSVSHAALAGASDQPATAAPPPDRPYIERESGRESAIPSLSTSVEA